MCMSETQHTSMARSIGRILVHISIGGAMGIVFPGVYQALGATESLAFMLSVLTVTVIVLTYEYVRVYHWG